MPKITEGLLTVNQAAEFLGLHPQTVRNNAKIGKLPAFRMGNRYYFDPNDLVSLITRVRSTVKNDTIITDIK